MAQVQLADKVVETDVLVMGGGVGGCPTAAKIAELGLRVTVAEKANSARSGHSGAGMDHVMDFPREGVTNQDYVKYWQTRHSLLCGEGRWVNANIGYRLGKEAWRCLDEMEKLGLRMRWDDGEYHWVRHGWFGAKIMLGVHWLDVKPTQAAMMRRKGVNVLERTMVVDLLTNNGEVVGATAVNTRTGEFIVIKAKAVIVAAGSLQRIYEPETPRYYKYLFRYHGAPGAIAGDSFAVAYRAGAELVNMDVGTCWNYRIKDDLSIDYGVIDHGDGINGRYMTWTGQQIPFATTALYDEVERRGLDPIYCSVEHFSDDYHKRAEVCMADERLFSLKIGSERGFDPKTHRYELMAKKPFGFAGVPGLYSDEHFTTNVRGLFVIGDACSGLGGSGSAIMSGLLTAADMPGFVGGASEPTIDEAQVAKQKREAMGPTNVKDGVSPLEVEVAIRHICERYVGIHKSEGKLLEGLRRLHSLKRHFMPKVAAKNPHYLMRCLELRNLMEMAEIHMKAVLSRQESRGGFIRMDFPDRNPERDNKVTFQRLVKGEVVLETREIPELKPEYAGEV